MQLDQITDMKKHLLLLAIATLAMATTARAQAGKDLQAAKEVSDMAYTSKVKPMVLDTTDSTKHWIYGSNININVSQIALVNWAAGGNNSVGINALGGVWAKYAKNKFVWDMKLDLAYGVQKQGKLPFRKSDDQILFNSQLGYQFAKSWQLGFITNFRSQFAPGYEYPDDTTSNLVSRIMAPAYIINALGIEYEAPKYFKLFVSPITSKTTTVLANDIDPVKYGLDSNKHVLEAVGAYVTATFTADIWKNVNYYTKVELFSDYLQNPQNIAVIWNNKLTLKVNDYLNVSIVTDLIYDDKVLVPKTRPDGTAYQGKGTQFRENLALSVGYKFDSRTPKKKKDKTK